MKNIHEETRKPSGTDASSIPKKESLSAIDRNAPAGSENSLGEESVRDGRPSTEDNVVEAIDEMAPGTRS